MFFFGENRRVEVEGKRGNGGENGVFGEREREREQREGEADLRYFRAENCSNPKITGCNQ